MLVQVVVFVKLVSFLKDSPRDIFTTPTPPSEHFRYTIKFKRNLFGVVYSCGLGHSDNFHRINIANGILMRQQ